MTLWELAPFQVRSSVFETESYLMWLQKRKGGLWHQIWGWRQFPWAERQSEWQPEAENCVSVPACTCAHTHTPLLAGLHQLTYLGLQKNTLYKVKHFSTCMYHGSVHRFWYTKTSLMSQMVICLSNIWGLKAPKLRHPGSFLWHLAMRKQHVYSYPFFFPFHIALQRNPSI